MVLPVGKRRFTSIARAVTASLTLITRSDGWSTTCLSCRRWLLMLFRDETGQDREFHLHRQGRHHDIDIEVEKHKSVPSQDAYRTRSDSFIRYKEPFRRYTDVQISRGEPVLVRHHKPRHHHGDHVEVKEEKVTISSSTTEPKAHRSPSSLEAFTSSIPRQAGNDKQILVKMRHSRGADINSITIPCHHIRVGDLLILQGRPCQVIRISTSEQTGQHRYLGVDLFTKQLHEESSFVSNPAPSVLVQNMTGPVFKQYRVLDLADDGTVVAMTESGDIKQTLAVLDQSSLFGRLRAAFDKGRGGVRVLVIDDGGREMAVDYKLVHGSTL